MRPDQQLFAAKVELPCQLFYGPDLRRQVPGMVLNIDTGSLVVALSQESGFVLSAGDRVRLETLFPGSEKSQSMRCLSCRAQVTKTTELPDGSLHAELTFRKASFKDVGRTDRGKAAKAAIHTGWAM